VQHYVTAVYL